jgi:phosphoglycerate dehydrogenase-like enzyme
MRIVFHGSNASTFEPGLSDLLEVDHEIKVVSDALDGPGESDAIASADAVVGVSYSRDHPQLSARLYQLPAAGHDNVDFRALPEDCEVCNCFGHEQAIAEYVMAALLTRHVPLSDADSRLRRRDWHYWAGGPDGLRTELGSQSIGIIGHGHIGRTVADRALVFGMRVHVANRSPVDDPRFAASWSLDALARMMGQVDVVLNTLPLADSTRGLIGANELAAMQPHGIIMNVGRGPVIDEDALYEVLTEGRIGGAVLDTWYVYPGADDPAPFPAHRPFHELNNVTLTPHMSGWTDGTIARRCAAIAENMNRLAAGRPLVNVVRPAKPQVIITTEEDGR